MYIRAGMRTALIVIVLVLLLVFARAEGFGAFSGFSIGGYPIGEYNPAMYPSEITRTV